MSFRYDIRLSGSGGQGLIMMGIILAEAIGVYDGKEVAQTQSYGPEARGGSSKAEVIVSDEEIDFPKAIKVDLLLAMNQKALDEYYGDLKPDGMLIVDSTFVKTIPVAQCHPDTLYAYRTGSFQKGDGGQHRCPRARSASSHRSSRRRLLRRLCWRGYPRVRRNSTVMP